MDRRKHVNLPNFLIAGASKSGTTSLYYYLKQHPEVFLCSPKEPHFFLAQIAKLPMNGIGDSTRVAIKDVGDYCRLFDGAAGRPAVGESSGSTLRYYEKTIPMIKYYLGNPRIVIVLRNPVDRAFSAYTSLVLQGRERLSFEDALKREDERIQDNWRHSWHYVQGGMYYESVKAFLNNFSDVKVCLFDDLVRAPVPFMQEIYSFLGVDASFIPDVSAKFSVSGIPRLRLVGLLMKSGALRSAVISPVKYLFKERGWLRLRDALRERLLTKNEMSPETRQYLCELYREDILRVQTLLRRDLGHWLMRSGE